MSGFARRLAMAAAATLSGPPQDEFVVGMGAMSPGSASYAIPSDGSARYVSPSGSNTNGGTSVGRGTYLVSRCILGTRDSNGNRFGTSPIMIRKNLSYQLLGVRYQS